MDCCSDMIEQFKQDLQNHSVDEVYDKYFISGDVWIVKQIHGVNWHEKYDELKLFISNRLSVHFNDIAIAGSGKLGFSMDPKKNYKCFSEESDIDIIVISQKLFYRFWEAYRRDSYAEIKTPHFTTVTFWIFRKYLSAENLSKTNEDYISWEKQTQGFEKDLQTRFLIENDIHYRIFESWDSAKEYYINGLRKLKDNLEGCYEN